MFSISGMVFCVAGRGGNAPVSQAESVGVFAESGAVWSRLLHTPVGQAPVCLSWSCGWRMQ
jgi:hypothetical protein